MGEYRRFVSYLYEYRNEKKEKIAGAVRVDCRGVRTQIRVDVRESQSPGQAVLLGYGVPEQPLGMVLRNAGAGGESYMWRQESGQPEFAVYSGLRWAPPGDSGMISSATPKPIRSSAVIRIMLAASFSSSAFFHSMLAKPRGEMTE